MNKKIHPTNQVVTFKCASCGAEFNILSTVKDKTVGIDVCSNCHPLYQSGIGEQKAKGRAERLAHKFKPKTSSKDN
jgi:large subunit ribosomal protein L31